MRFNLAAVCRSAHVCNDLRSNVAGAPRGPKMERSGFPAIKIKQRRSINTTDACCLPAGACKKKRTCRQRRFDSSRTASVPAFLGCHIPLTRIPTLRKATVVYANASCASWKLRALILQNLRASRFSISKKPPPPSSITMDPQEESSSTVSRRETTPNRHEDLQDADIANIPASLTFKSRPTTEICRNHEVCYSSQYTRPVTELLNEVLKELYPVSRDDGGEELPLLGEERGVQQCGWFPMLARYLRWT